MIARLARPAPASIDFAEVRFSPLLQQPLVVSGSLGYSGPAALDRHVQRPYREDTEIRGDSVTVKRDGDPDRTLALKRAPELQGLLNAFTALLTGDQASIEKNFSIEASAEGSSWRLDLAPLDKRIRRRTRQIKIDGHAGTPRCLSMENANGGASVMLLGPAAHTALPDPLTREWLSRFCSRPPDS